MVGTGAARSWPARAWRTAVTVSCLLGIIYLHGVRGCPLRFRSDESIRAEILRETPAGTTWREVERIADYEGYTVTSGYFTEGRIGHSPYGSLRDNGVVAEVGGYASFPVGTTRVYVEWRFGAGGTVTGVEVRRDLDTL